jgi:Zn-dependent protease with chaperone function
METLFVAFSESSLGDPAPPGWVELMLGTHPSLVDRIAMARAWSERNGP